MGELRQATDAEVVGWTAAKYLEDYGEDAVITDLEDLASLVGQAAEQVHEHGATHLITEIAVWPFPAEAEALVTLDLPSGIRLCTLCISHKHLRPDHTQAADGAAVIRHVLANVLSAARDLAEEYETEISRRTAQQAHHDAGQDSGKEQDTPGTTANMTERQPSSHEAGGVQPRDVASVRSAEARYQAAQARYKQAAAAFTSQILRWLSAAIRAAFPQAAWLETYGLFNEEQEQQLRAVRIFGPAGTLVADAETLATPADRAFAALAETLTPALDQLAYLNGVDYLGAGRIDLT
jgi:hypothetical protein